MPKTRIPNYSYQSQKFKISDLSYKRLHDIQNRLASKKGFLSRQLTDDVKSGLGFFSKNGYEEHSWQFIDDDHKPFLEKDVPILHLIPVPFPSVWHTKDDNGAAIDLETVKDWALIMNFFVFEYLGVIL